MAENGKFPEILMDIKPFSPLRGSQSGLTRAFLTCHGFPLAVAASGFLNRASSIFTP